MEREELWQAVLAQVQLQISPANFSTWFKNTEIHSFENGEVIISVPNTFVKEWLEQKYSKMILKILKNLNKDVKSVKFLIGKSGNPILNNSTFIYSPQLEIFELKIDKETNLNPKYKFSNFVVGSFNELAYAAAKAVCENPGSVYNPLFIYGGVGLGKTHLLQAIGNEILRIFPKKKVKYLPAEKMVSQIVEAIRKREIESFKEKIQELDVLIIDDIQFISGKEKTQEEFFHIFNALYEKGKQIVLSSDKPPRAIQFLTERLRSRFEGGMIADIGQPDFETRVAILKEKSAEKGVEFDEEIINFIASQITQNIRKLEGALNRLINYLKLNGKPPTLEKAKELLKDWVFTQSQILTPKKIIRKIAEFYDLTEKELLSNTRKKEIVKPRQIAMYLLKKEFNESFSSIGRLFGGKDHTTVIHAFEKIEKALGKDESLAQEILLVKERIIGS